MERTEYLGKLSAITLKLNDIQAELDKLYAEELSGKVMNAEYSVQQAIHSLNEID